VEGAFTLSLVAVGIVNTSNFLLLGGCGLLTSLLCLFS
jgi:hypothetical protein